MSFRRGPVARRGAASTQERATRRGRSGARSDRERGAEMNGNFDPRQNLKDHGRTVDARGWLSWDVDDDFAEITITVIQDGYECSGPTVRCEPPSEEWRVEVTRAAPPPWSRGPASGRAAAVVTKTDGTTQDNPWDSPPLTLH
jgi:hypothetical protein